MSFLYDAHHIPHRPELACPRVDVFCGQSEDHHPLNRHGGFFILQNIHSHRSPNFLQHILHKL